MAKKSASRLVNFKCRGCSKVERHPFNSGKHWCNCNPAAKHELIFVETLERAEAMAKALRK